MWIFGEWWRRHPAPTPPENVRLIQIDGSTIPLDCAYDGYRDGTHVWNAIVPAGVDVSLEDIRIDMIPANASIGFKLPPANR